MSAEPYEQQVVRLVMGAGSGLSFEIAPTRAFGRCKLAGARTVFVQWVAPELLPDVDRSPIRDFREERIAEARNAAAEIADDGHAKIANRIYELIDLANSDWPDTEIPSSQAIQTLGRVLRRLGRIPSPGITLTDSGQLWLQWVSGDSQVALIIGPEGVPAIAALLPDSGSLGRAAHFNFHGSEEQVAVRLTSDPLLQAALAG